MRVLTILAVAAGLLATATVAPAFAADDPQTIAVDGASAGRTFDGVGSLSAGASSRLLIDYPEPERSRILDYLFKPGYGAAQQIFKVEIGGDTNSTDGTEPSHMHEPGDLSCDRGYEWWLMEQAKQRNPDIKLAALAWGTPGWVGGGRQTVWTPQYVDYLLSWLGCAKQHGLRIDYIGGWNERGYDVDWYKQLRAALDSHGYGDVKVVADDSWSWNVMEPLLADPAFADAVDVVGEHYVCGYLGAYESCPSPSYAQDFGKPLWASEQGSQPYDTGAIPLARAINREYTDGRMTGTINWSTEWSAYAGLPFEGDGLLLANEPWSGHYVVGPSVWAVAQTTQFTSPGWRYVDSASARIDGGSVVTLRAPAGGDWSAVAETLDATAPQQVRFEVSHGLSAGTVHVWETDLSSKDPGDWFVRDADVKPGDGAFTATLQPGRVYTFTTTTGQGKGEATSPAPRDWPLPYHDNFDGYPADSTPRYVSDLGGSFATAPCVGRDGMCLRSMVHRQPVQWNSLDNHPLTVVGDPSGWRDYTVAVDARVGPSGEADLGGRVVNGISGYHLKLAADGTWTLSKVTPGGAATRLAGGTLASPGEGWHRLALRMRALDVTARIDGQDLATVSDHTYEAGQVSLGGSAWHELAFDDLVVTPVGEHASRLELEARPPSAYVSRAGDAASLDAHVANPGPAKAGDVSVTLEPPAGWTATPTGTGPASLDAGQSADWGWKLVAPAGAQEGRYSATLKLSYRSGGQSGTVTREVPVLLGVIPHERMTATADSAQSADYAPSRAIDDDTTTMWHTQWSPYEPLPHELTLDLGGSYDVSGLRYLPRQDNNHHGVITSYAVSVSDDGVHFTQVASGGWADDFAQKSVRFAAQQARYVRLTALAGDSGYASAAEVDVFGTPSR